MLLSAGMIEMPRSQRSNCIHIIKLLRGMYLVEERDMPILGLKHGLEG